MSMSIDGLTALVPLFKKNWITGCELPRGVKADAAVALKDAAGMVRAEDTLVAASLTRLSSAFARVITPGEVPQLRTDLGRVINWWRAK
jgi:hypothetical protein